MTARQAEIWDLYARGHGPSEIAVALGLKSRGGVSSALKKIKQELQSPTKRVMESAACRYSSSCFSCPLRDCDRTGDDVHTEWDRGAIPGGSCSITDTLAPRRLPACA